MAQTATTANRRFAAVACVIMVIVTLSIACIFYWLYETSKENILAQWRNETQQAGQKISQYLKMPIDAVSFSAVTVNAMQRDGKSHEEVGRYLVAETSIYSSIISDNTTVEAGFRWDTPVQPGCYSPAMTFLSPPSFLLCRAPHRRL